MRAENLGTFLLQLKNNSSIKDECQTQHDVWPGKQTRIQCRFMVTAGQETRRGMVENTERGDKGMLRGPCCKCHFVLSTLLKMWRWIFKMQPQLSFLKPSADIWDSGLPALRRHRKQDGGQGGVLCQPRAQERGTVQDDRCGHIVTAPPDCTATFHSVSFTLEVELEQLSNDLNFQRLKSKW